MTLYDYLDAIADDPNAPRWVVGYIDAYGAVHARATRENDMHSNADKLAGHVFRWSIVRNDWPYDYDTTHCRLLTQEERLIVEDWLEKNGYKVSEDDFRQSD